MLTIQRIVCPVDFSACSDQAVHVAMELAQRLHASVELVHVMQTSAYVVPLMPMGGAPLDFMQELPERMKKQMFRMREQLATKYPKVITGTSLCDGSIHTMIVQRARELRADLLVIGTHGHTGFTHALLGSIAERVVRTAHCPVLTVGPAQLGASEAVAPTHNRILCAIDFSKPSLLALDHAAELARTMEAELHIVHVITLNEYAVASHDPLDSADFEARVRQEVTQRLDVLKEKHSSDDLRVSVSSLDGIPHAAIERVADQLGASWIVVGTHGHTGLQHWLLGSVAEKVVRTARVPVLTVREQVAEQRRNSLDPIHA